VYKGLEDLAERIMTRTNYSFSRVVLSTNDNWVVALPEPVYVYTDVIKLKLVSDSLVRLLTSLHFPSIQYPLYKPVEQSFIELIAIRLVTKTGEDVVFEDNGIQCLVFLHFKKMSSTRQVSVCQIQWINIHCTS
jgi:hypothetical protein